jgi:hypothetical protein
VGGLDYSDLGLTPKVTRLGKSYWTKEFPIASVEIEDGIFEEISSYFVEVARFLNGSTGLLSAAIDFRFTYFDPNEVRGLFIPGWFVEKIAPWSPSLDVAVQVLPEPRN